MSLRGATQQPTRARQAAQWATPGLWARRRRNGRGEEAARVLSTALVASGTGHGRLPLDEPEEDTGGEGGGGGLYTTSGGRRRGELSYPEIALPFVIGTPEFLADDMCGLFAEDDARGPLTLTLTPILTLTLTLTLALTLTLTLTLPGP